MSRDLLDLVRELNTLNDDNLADRVIENSDVQWCLSELQDILEEMPTLAPPNEPLISGFDVIDTKTGEYPDLWEIALKEDWANGLMYCDMEGFAIEEDGTLLLLDECGKHAYCPEGRFKIVPRPPEGEEDT